MTTNNPPRTDTSIMLVCVTVLVCVVVESVAVAWVFAPKDTDPTPIAAVMLGTLAPTIAALAAVVKVGGVSSQVADVAEDTNKLANGLGDAKIRAAVADVLPDHMIDPDAKPQLEADKRHRLMSEEHH